MKPKAVVKILIDVLMTLALLILMGFQFWGDKAHEWIGVGIFALCIIHQIMNRNWYKNLTKGNDTYFRICGSIVDILLLIAMLLLAYSSVVISRYVFDFFKISGGISFARRLHILASYWGFLLMSAHLGLHWSMVIGIMQKHIQFAIRSKVPSLIGFLIAAYGGYVFIKRDFPIYMLLRSEFVFLDYSESKILFYLDYLALMGLFIFVFHYVEKILRANKISKKPWISRF